MHYITKKYSKNTLYNKEKQRKALYNKDNLSKNILYNKVYKPNLVKL